MGLLLLLAMTAAAWALAGPAAGCIAFLSVALVRVALRVRALELENQELRRHLREEGRAFDQADVEALQLELFGEETPSAEIPPQSGTRQSVTDLRARHASSGD